MQTNWLDNEVYAIRDHESMQLLRERPAGGRYIAVMARSVELPPGEHSKERSADGAPVEQATIVAAEFGAKHENWHWVRLSPPTKEFVGDLIFDNQLERDRWYYLQITDLHLAARVEKYREALSLCRTELAYLIEQTSAVEGGRVCAAHAAASAILDA